MKQVRSKYLPEFLPDLWFAWIVSSLGAALILPVFACGFLLSPEFALSFLHGHLVSFMLGAILAISSLAFHLKALGGKLYLASTAAALFFFALLRFSGPGAEFFEALVLALSVSLILPTGASLLRAGWSLQKIRF
ncbi:MAG: hypothetical protein IPM23_23955 [Candidatus Melainabacteria bacterium]|nr:hypothetical protein [Candidatus Melainabacteria bacterium]